MFEIRQVRELKVRKAYLISECGLERSLIAAEASVLEKKTKWSVLLFTGAVALIPRLHFLVPVLGWLIARGLGRGKKGSVGAVGINLGGWVRKGVLAWQLFKKGCQLWTQWRSQRVMRRLHPAG